jgi:hypothetical protein
MEMFCSDDVKELAGAMLKVQAEINPAIKDAANPFAKSRYATLNSVITASREALLKNEIWVVQFPVPVESGHLGLVTKLTHGPSGQWQSSLMVMPLAKFDPQGYGSAMTYARRYSMAALIGIIVEDDDGEKACGHTAAIQDVSKQASKSNGHSTFNSSFGDRLPEGEPLDNLQLDRLPKLEGITYKSVKSNDGTLCIIAVGDTYPKRDILSGTGFRWNPGKNVWWRNADTAQTAA